MSFAELPADEEIRAFLDQLRPYLEADGYDAKLHSMPDASHVIIALSVPEVRSVSQQVLLEMALKARLFEEFPSLDSVDYRAASAPEPPAGDSP